MLLLNRKMPLTKKVHTIKTTIPINPETITFFNMISLPSFYATSLGSHIVLPVMSMLPSAIISCPTDKAKTTAKRIRLTINAGPIYVRSLARSIRAATYMAAKARASQINCRFRKKAWLENLSLPSAIALDDEYTITVPIRINAVAIRNSAKSILWCLRLNSRPASFPVFQPGHDRFEIPAPFLKIAIHVETRASRG